MSRCFIRYILNTARRELCFSCYSLCIIWVILTGVFTCTFWLIVFAAPVRLFTSDFYIKNDCSPRIFMLNTTVHLGFLFEPRLFTSDFYLSHDCSPRILIWASTVHHKKNVNLECSAQNFCIKSVCSTGLSVSPTIFFVVQKCAPPILGRHQNRLRCSEHTFFSCTGKSTVTTTPNYS